MIRFLLRIPHTHNFGMICHLLSKYHLSSPYTPQMHLYPPNAFDRTKKALAVGFLLFALIKHNYAGSKITQMTFIDAHIERLQINIIYIHRKELLGKHI